MAIELKQCCMDRWMRRRGGIGFVSIVVRKERMDDEHIGSTVFTQKQLELALDGFRVVMIHIE